MLSPYIVGMPADSDVSHRAPAVSANGPTVSGHLSGEAEALLQFNDDGLIAAIVQDAANGQILMMAWMNRDTLRLSLAEGRTVFWSRSRQEVWRKGDTSGDRQFIRSASFDCDGDSLLFVVDQEGKGACHTGERSCFFRDFDLAPVGFNG